MPKGNRPDYDGPHRTQFAKNKLKILASQDICGICGLPVDKSLKWPDPMSATVDHIIPVKKGGHPSDISNLQLAHFACNRQKSDHIPGKQQEKKKVEEIISNNDLPQSRDWISYRSG